MCARPDGVVGALRTETARHDPGGSADGRNSQLESAAGYRAEMDQHRARELISTERARIERALAHLEQQDTGEPADEVDPGNLASELYQGEFDEGQADDLREELAAVERAEARLAAGTYGLSIESGKAIPDERLEAVPTAERTVEEEAH